jgi:beta-N-acetylhexosaminidase
MATIEQSLSATPFRLGPIAIDWVRQTFTGLTVEQRIAQLFVLRSGVDEAEFEQIKRFQPGGITAVYGANPDQELKNVTGLVAESSVPPLISADLEGSRMSLPFGTQVLNPLGLAAVNDLDATAEISRIMAEEGRAAGINWSFTPVIDIGKAFRSAIVGTRGFGSSIDIIERHALKQIEVFQNHGIAATAKHWPGEGYDDRDQHLLTTVNPLNIAEWDATFGRLYRAAIGAGVYCIMTGHIAFPAFIRSIERDAGIEAFRPASISSLLNVSLLREKLGFNGLIVSDATPMAGLRSWCRIEDAIPQVIENGCDVILFSTDPDGDSQRIQSAIVRGTLRQDRIDQAVMRVLGLKAALGLHRSRSMPRSMDGLDTKGNGRIAEAITARSPTLVKDVQNILPIDPTRHRRVLVITPGIIEPWLPAPIPFAVPAMLSARGFEMTNYSPGMEIAPSRFDLILYLFGEETLVARNRIFIDWLRLGGDIGAAMRRHWHDIPTIMISFGYPYLLYDAPRVPTYINAYSTLESVQQTVVDALLGNRNWNRHSPVDPFCGLEDARY